MLRVTGSVDTHHVAVVLMNGRRLADREFPATAAGHGDLPEFTTLLDFCLVGPFAALRNGSQHAIEHSSLWVDLSFAPMLHG
jgi:hypothetical protein